MTSAVARRLVFGADVFGEVLFSSRAVLSSAARAHLSRTVTDDPTRVAGDFSVSINFGGLEPKSGSFGWTRHLSLISSIARSVVNCFPAIVSIASRPRAA